MKRRRSRSCSSVRGGGIDRLMLLPFTSFQKGYTHQGLYESVYGVERKLLTKVPDSYIVTVEAKKLTSVPDERINFQNENGTSSQYRKWDPFESDLAAAILGEVKNIWLRPGSRVLYLANQSSITVSHVSDLVGPTGTVYVVVKHDTDLVTLSNERANVVPIFEDSRHPAMYWDKVKRKVDVIISEEPNDDKVRIVAANASAFLRHGGKFIMLQNAQFEIPFVPDEVEFELEVEELEKYPFKIVHHVTLEPFQNFRACLIGVYY